MVFLLADTPGDERAQPGLIGVVEFSKIKNVQLTMKTPTGKLVSNGYSVSGFRWIDPSSMDFLCVNPEGATIQVRDNVIKVVGDPYVDNHGLVMAPSPTPGVSHRRGLSLRGSGYGLDCIPPLEGQYEECSGVATVESTARERKTPWWKVAECALCTKAIKELSAHAHLASNPDARA